MEKKRFLVVFVIWGVVCSMFISCGTSTEDIAKQVQEGILESYNTPLENPWGWALEIQQELKLVKKSKTEYTGLMTINRGPGGITRLSVDVLFDGKTIQYEWIER